MSLDDSGPSASAAQRRDRTTAAPPPHHWHLSVLTVLPLVLLLAFWLGDGGDDSGERGFVDLAQESGANLVIFTLFASTSFLLVVIVALFAGDTVPSEASWASLRYLLAAPVRRERLLRQKLS